MNNQILWVDLIIAYALLKIVADVFVKLIFDARFFTLFSSWDGLVNPKNLSSKQKRAYFN